MTQDQLQAPASAAPSPIKAGIDIERARVARGGAARPALLGRPAAQAAPPGQSWMSALSGNRLLSELTIPGTHDTCALHGGPLAATQTMSLSEQLNAGIRFLDIRCRHIQNVFAIHHGPIFQNIFFGDVVRICAQFLATNPEETILMSVKEEYDAQECTRSFEDTFDWYVSSTAPWWSLGRTIPRLDDVRGRIVLLRRFPGTSTGGIDASGWSDDATFTLDHGAFKIRVQDEYAVPTLFAISTKWDRVQALLDEARSSSGNDLYVNFTSGSSAGAYPNAVAKGSWPFEGMNDRLKAYLDKGGRLGVIPLDFPEYPDGDLVSSLYGRNG